MKNDYRAFMVGAIVFGLTTLIYGLAALGYDTSYAGARYWGLTSTSYTVSGEPTFLKYFWSGTVVAAFMLVRIAFALLIGLAAGALCYVIVWMCTGASEGPKSAVPSVPPAPKPQTVTVT
ncbi:MAG: hypothetical protein AAB365_01715 [Patescibacteria group bacterium]